MSQIIKYENGQKSIEEFHQDFSLMETHLKIIGCDFRRSEYPHDSLFYFSVCAWLNKNTDWFINIRKDYLGMFHAQLTYKGGCLFEVESTKLDDAIGYIFENI